MEEEFEVVETSESMDKIMDIHNIHDFGIVCTSYGCGCTTKLSPE